MTELLVADSLPPVKFEENLNRSERFQGQLNTWNVLLCSYKVY